MYRFIVFFGVQELMPSEQVPLIVLPDDDFENDQKKRSRYQEGDTHGEQCPELEHCKCASEEVKVGRVRSYFDIELAVAANGAVEIITYKMDRLLLAVLCWIDEDLLIRYAPCVPRESLQRRKRRRHVPE